MLLQLRDFIHQQGIVSLQQLVREFRVEGEALQPMLAIWIVRGVIRVATESKNCQSKCGRCQNRTIFYQYIH